MSSVALFCGSKTGSDSEIEREVSNLCELLAIKDFDLVYGGASIGLMGICADIFLHNKRKVSGVIPKAIEEMEVTHRGLSHLEIVDNMHTRKERMYELSDSFVILPGGFGTMDEFFEILTWKQLGYHQKKIILFNSNNYYEHLLAQLAMMTEKGFVSKNHHKLYEVHTNRNDIVKSLQK